MTTKIKSGVIGDGVVGTTQIADDAVTSAKLDTNIAIGGTLDVTGAITTDGLTTTGDINLGDNDKAIFGAGSDLQIYHDGSNSYIDEVGTGHLFVRSNGDGIYFRSSTNEEIAHFNVNGSVKLYHDNSLKLETTAAGIDVTGNVDISVGQLDLDTNYRVRWNGSNDYSIHSDANNYLRFITAGSERMRIDSSGQLIVGGTSPVQPSKVGIQGGSSVNRLLTFEVTHTTPFGAVGFHNGNGLCGSISVYTNSVTYNTSSDYRLKENVVTDWDATTRLKQLRPSRFNFIADAETTVDGFLAHEVQDIVPEAITGTKDAMRDEEYEVTPAVLDDDGNVVTEAVMGTRSVPDYQGIDQSKLVPLLVKTIQELEERITTLENA
jgi:hypothetical protein